MRLKQDIKEQNLTSNNQGSKKLGFPDTQGLYDSANEKDACGIGFITNMHNKKSHKIIQDGLAILENLEHRGAVGADPKAGDGCGMLTQIPHKFFEKLSKKEGVTLPNEGDYAVGFIFLPKDEKQVKAYKELVEKIVKECKHEFLGWRKIPVDNSDIGYSVKPTEPDSYHFFIKKRDKINRGEDFEVKLFIIRRLIEVAVDNHSDLEQKDFFYISSLSSQTIVYKGMLLSTQLGGYFKDLTDEDFTSALALVHQRFSTNTFPSWGLSHPFRMICHNGEINTLRGNKNWMAARQKTMKSEIIGKKLKNIWPLIKEGQSDSASFDNALELLIRGGYSIAHAMMMMIPESWDNNPLISKENRAFYEFHAALMEPWDGPAAIAFTDGKKIGATLDRNGLRPARYVVTEDGTVMLASEMGVLPIDEATITQKWRLQPGKMLLVDLEKGMIIHDEDIKKNHAKKRNYRKMLAKTQIYLNDIEAVESRAYRKIDNLIKLQKTYGYTEEDIKYILKPMARSGQEPIGSMGNDTPPAALSSKPTLLHNYFKQLFAQVTNPPIDPIREEAVMSLVSFIGPRPNLLDLKGTDKFRRLAVKYPIIDNDELEKVRSIGEISDNKFKTRTLDITFSAVKGVKSMVKALDRVCAESKKAVDDGYNIIILSDWQTNNKRAPIPSLLATSAVHHHLIRVGMRTSVGIVVETGEAKEINQFCTLAAFGAEAINPYLAFDSIRALSDEIDPELDEETLQKRYIKAANKGILKVMSKMGISTYQSYCGAQIYDIIGINDKVVNKYFAGTNSKIGGVGLEEIAEETLKRHNEAFNNPIGQDKVLTVGGDYAQRIRGESHIWNYNTISNIQHAVRGNSQEKYNEFAKEIDDQNKQLLTLRGLFTLKSAVDLGKTPVSIDEVEPATEILKRFATGAMSYGSISLEAHTTLALAMNRLGGKSNTGEGGEEVERFKTLANGDSKRSAIKQVASGRFGVTGEYLVNSDVIQIKMAQGAKPGEGGQLPGHKVNAVIAKVRHSTQGVGLISPPPHHDIYSIEDLAQLIYDLKCANEFADISVKLVSEVGVGTVAAGVSKARADQVTISGYDGGTGASPLTSIKHAGSPWEVGLAETHQTLLLNNLRDRISVQVDGGLRTGRDVIIGALLGADEFGFATAPLITMGCLMMRKCHLNTCPVGIATQDPVLRKRFTGTPEHVINYFTFIAQEVRVYMAKMGVRKLSELIGAVEYLDTNDAIRKWKSKNIDYSKLFYKPGVPSDYGTFKSIPQNHPIKDVLDRKLISKAKDAIENKTPTIINSEIKNTDRTVGTLLSAEIARKYGSKGLKDDSIFINLNGIAGQSFGAFLAKGVTLNLEGEANDYVGKGLSGGKIIINPPKVSQIVPEESIIVGNTVLYGATSGECYFRGVGGERFAVRNSGAVAVVEGVGDHGCEYMTGGVVVVLGKTGRNFAAGMSGGIAYILDETSGFEKRCNMSMVELEPILDEEEIASSDDHQRADLQTHGIIEINHHLSQFDAKRLHQLLENHKRYTNSARATEILENWNEYLPKFKKVMPLEYRRALMEIEQMQKSKSQAGSKSL